MREGAREGEMEGGGGKEKEWAGKCCLSSSTLRPVLGLLALQDALLSAGRHSSAQVDTSAPFTLLPLLISPFFRALCPPLSLYKRECTGKTCVATDERRKR